MSQSVSLGLASTVLIDPSPEDVRAIFIDAPHIAEKVLRPLDPATGNVAKGEVQCIGIISLDHNRFYVQVIYRTARPDGKTGTQFMRFYPFSAAMRCLPVTTDGRVIMIEEHRRMRGEWVRMLPAGGAKRGDAVEVLIGELIYETGSKAGIASRITQLPSRYMDDGVFAERLHLLTIDRLIAPEAHQYVEETIRSIVLVPWKEWRQRALDGEYDDVYCEVFAARCEYDAVRGRILVRGRHAVLAPGTDDIPEPVSDDLLP